MTLPQRFSITTLRERLSTMTLRQRIDRVRSHGPRIDWRKIGLYTLMLTVRIIIAIVGGGSLSPWSAFLTWLTGYWLCNAWSVCIQCGWCVVFILRRSHELNLFGGWTRSIHSSGFLFGFACSNIVLQVANEYPLSKPVILERSYKSTAAFSYEPYRGRVTKTPKESWAFNNRNTILGSLTKNFLDIRAHLIQIIVLFSSITKECILIACHHTLRNPLSSPNQFGSKCFVWPLTIALYLGLDLFLSHKTSL